MGHIINIVVLTDIAPTDLEPDDKGHHPPKTMTGL